mmetsp:Transcript_42080/g.61912  ORF Transcript_42080/g.61912 Transcript_42080/m.61912 type:complete len:97 (-) Transcript_42080:282-572(-)
MPSTHQALIITPDQSGLWSTGFSHKALRVSCTHAIFITQTCKIFVHRSTLVKRNNICREHGGETATQVLMATTTSKVQMHLHLKWKHLPSSPRARK